MTRVEKLRERMKHERLDAMLIIKPENRTHISGFTGSSAYILIMADKAQVITDFRYIEQAKEQCVGFDVVNHCADIVGALNNALRDRNTRTLGFEMDFVTYDLYEKLTEGLDVALKPVAGLIEEIRAIKEEEEIECLQMAQSIAEEAFKDILGMIRAGVKESDVALALEFKMRKLGADRLAFIGGASGKRSALPHGRPTDKVLEVGDFFTLDFGAYYQGYCGDMTRTVVIGEASAKQQEVYKIVKDAQQAALDAARPGITGFELDKVARDVIANARYGECFGHSLGHGVGRVVHEAPRASTRSNDVLKPGHVITIEPGIYIPDWGGVRIEDMILITEDGYRNFNRSSKELMIL